MKHHTGAWVHWHCQFSWLYSRTSLFRSQADSCPFDHHFVLTRLFQNPAISNYFSCPVGLRNSGVRLYIWGLNITSAMLTLEVRWATELAHAVCTLGSKLLASLDAHKLPHAVMKKEAIKTHLNCQMFIWIITTVLCWQFWSKSCTETIQ